jgi:hypothetical protein
MPLEVWNPRWSRSLQRLFNTKSPAAPLVCLDDVMPVVSMSDPTANEQHFQRGEVPFAVSGSCAGTAVNYASLALDARPGYLVVVETVQVSGVAAALSLIGYMGGLGGSNPATNPVGLDLRTPNVPGLQFDLASNNTGPAGNECGRWYFPALNAPVLLFGAEAAIILCNATVNASNPATGAFNLKAGAVNIGFNFWLTGYTRPLDTGETAP